MRRSPLRVAAGVLVVGLFAWTAAADSFFDHVDADWFRSEMIAEVDLWNGGLDGQHGMETYRADWDGRFQVILQRDWTAPEDYWNWNTSVIAQSRAIYINCEAYRAAGTAQGERFRQAVQTGADTLLAKSIDPVLYNGNPGGFYWGLLTTGVTPPYYHDQIGGTNPVYKHTYGQAHATFSLAHAYSITGDMDHLDGALFGLDTLNAQFAEAGGGFRPTQNREFTSTVESRNLDYMCHIFETLLALHDTVSDPARLAAIDSQLVQVGDFITERLYRDQAGTNDRGYFHWEYTSSWSPRTSTNISAGHNLEIAYLLSRGVERGFQPGWLDVAHKLLNFALAYGYDPAIGAVRYQDLRPDGSAASSGARLGWWQQAELARALMHFASLRGRDDLWDELDTTLAFLQGQMIDPVYGGWYGELYTDTLEPSEFDKGHVWKVGYHETMLYAEALRLAALLEVPGDANGDGLVNDADLSLLLAHWAATGPTIGWGEGDFNDDQTVDDSDLSLLLARWGHGVAVPEPAVLALLAGGALATRRRRQP